MSTSFRSQSRTKPTTTGRLFSMNFLDIAVDLEFCMKRNVEKPFAPVVTDILWVHAVARIYQYMNKKLPEDVHKALGENHEVSNQKNFRYFYSCLPISEKRCQVEQFAKGRQEAIDKLVSVDEKLKRAEVNGSAFADDLDLAEEKCFPAFGVFSYSRVPTVASYENVKLERDEARMWLTFVSKQKQKLHEAVEDFRNNTLKSGSYTVEELGEKVDRFLRAVAEMEWEPKVVTAKPKEGDEVAEDPNPISPEKAKKRNREKLSEGVPSSDEDNEDGIGGSNKASLKNDDDVLE